MFVDFYHFSKMKMQTYGSQTPLIFENCQTLISENNIESKSCHSD